MRPTSVIFLIISILLACLGGILCLRAYSIAEENGESLFASVKGEDGNYITTRYFGLSEDETPDTSNKKNDTKKLELSLSNVDVIIKGGQSVNKIELYNFTDGMYAYTTSVGGAATLEDLTGLMQMFSFTSGINFKGFRNLLFYSEYSKLERQVVIYLKDDSIITHISCTLENGDITLENVNLACDYVLSTKTGDISATGLGDGSSLTANVGTGDISVDRSHLYELNVKNSNGSVDVNDTAIAKTLLVNVAKGDVYYEHMGDSFEGFDVVFTATKGTLKIDDKKYSVGQYEFDGAPDKPTTPETPDEEGEETGSVAGPDYVPNSLTITVSEGDLTVIKTAVVVPETPETPEGSENPEDPEA